MVDHLTELKEACGSQEACEPEEKIKGGESRWFIGHPSPASPGTVALAQPGGFKLTFREEDVVEIRRHKNLFLVRTSANANLLVSVEQVMSATSIDRCECKPKETTAASERDADVWIWSHWGDDVFIFNKGPCQFRFDCRTITIPLLGPTYICIPSGFSCS